MTRTRTLDFELGIVTSVGCIISGAFISAGSSLFALAMMVAGSGFLYWACRQVDRDRWRSHPLRLTLPTFVAAQVMYWAVMVAGDQVPGLLDSSNPSARLPLDILTEACARYLLLHSPYWVGVALAYHAANPGGPPPRELKIRREVLFKVGLVALVGILGFAFTYGERGIPLPVTYFVTNVSRFGTICLGILALYAFLPGGRATRLGAWLWLAVLAAAGVIALSTTRMRVPLIEMITCMCFVAVTVRRIRPGRVILAACAAPVLLIAIAVMTSIKSTGAVEYQSTSLASSISSGLLTAISRAPSFQADAVAIQDPALRAVVAESRRTILAECIEGMPLTGLFSRNLRQTPETLDMAFHWAQSHDRDESSFFVSALTSISFAFGGAAATGIAALFGLLHGYAAARTDRSKCPSRWLVVQMAVLPIALHGLRRWDLVGIPVRLVLFYFTLLYLSSPKRRRRGAPLAPDRMRNLGHSSDNETRHAHLDVLSGAR